MPVPRTLTMEEVLRQKGWCTSVMLHSDLRPELPRELPLPPRHNIHNIQHHTRLRSYLPSQLWDSDKCSLLQINHLYFSPQSWSVISWYVHSNWAGWTGRDTASQRAACQPILLQPMHPLLLEWGKATSLGTYRTNSPPVQPFAIHYTLQLERPLMSHIHRFERLHVSHESPFQEALGWRRNTACRHSALGCDLISCIEKIWAQTLWRTKRTTHFGGCGRKIIPGKQSTAWLRRVDEAWFGSAAAWFYPHFSLPCSFLPLPPKWFTS